MERRVIYYNKDADRTCFELSEGVRPWDMLLILAEGAFSMTFPDTGETHVIEAFEIARFPANRPFVRKILTPLRFHQIAFWAESESDTVRSLTSGKLSIPKEQVAAIVRDMDVIAELPDHGELVLHTLEHILTEQYLYGKEGRERREGCTEDILEILRYLNDHLEEKINMEALAARVYLSRVGLVWKFKKQMGITPSQYLVMLRLRYAKQLLLEGDLRINEISVRCGYSNAYYFTNAFREQFGMSPTSFRKEALRSSERRLDADDHMVEKAPNFV